VFDGFNIFDSPGDAGGTGGPDWSNGPGCVWHSIFICIAMLLFIGFLKWMS